MFEHMKNYKALLQKISTWLRPTKQGGNGPSLLFIHIFCHKSMPYHFVEDDGWMAKNFFSGRPIPLASFKWSLTQVLPRWHYALTWSFRERITCPRNMSAVIITNLIQTYFQDDLTLIRSWYISGQHYSRTCEDWLRIQDSNRAGMYFLNCILRNINTSMQKVCEN